MNIISIFKLSLNYPYLISLLKDLDAETCYILGYILGCYMKVVTFILIWGIKFWNNEKNIYKASVVQNNIM